MIPEAKLDRRELLKVMAASAAFAGLTGCTKLPTQKIVPYVRQPEQIIPGKPLFYATRSHPRRRGHGRSGRKPHGAADED